MTKTMTVNEVAAELGVEPLHIKYAILNGTMPIGCVLGNPEAGRVRTVVIRERWEAWFNAKDLKKGE